MQWSTINGISSQVSILLWLVAMVIV